MLSDEERAGLEELIALKEGRLNMATAMYYAGMDVAVESLVLIGQQVMLFAARLLLDDQQRLTAGLDVSPHDDLNNRADVWVQVLVKKLHDGDDQGWANAAESYRMQALGVGMPEGEAG